MVIKMRVDQYPTILTPYSACARVNPSNSSWSIRLDREKDEYFKYCAAFFTACSFQPADLLQPRYAADANLGYWMVDKYDQEVDVYLLQVVVEHDNGTFEWLDGDGIWLPRRAVEGTFTVIGSFDARKAHL